ncbi:MAG: hypothetical protein U0Z44_03385 [Kouleothrix sp.]
MQRTRQVGVIVLALICAACGRPSPAEPTPSGPATAVIAGLAARTPGAPPAPGARLAAPTAAPRPMQPLLRHFQLSVVAHCRPTRTRA